MSARLVVPWLQWILTLSGSINVAMDEPILQCNCKTITLRTQRDRFNLHVPIRTESLQLPQTAVQDNALRAIGVSGDDNIAISADNGWVPAGLKTEFRSGLHEWSLSASNRLCGQCRP